MSFFRKIIHFFFPPKQSTSMSAIKAALRASRGSPRDREADPLAEKEARVRGKK
tara:strand:+ start:248 stop:409 length:162 start_codon:yes stop_codon:yes gene_type:complete